MHYRSIFISDVHLGSKGCQARILSNFLKHNTADKLYLIGDIIDGWKIQQNKWRWLQSHSNVIRRILNQAKRGTQVYYIAGNHDEFLRPMIPYGLSFGRIQISNQIDHIGIDGKKYLIIHGDSFDSDSKLAPLIGFFGDKIYEFILTLHIKIHWFLRKYNIRYFVPTKKFIIKTKKSVDIMLHKNFKKNTVLQCKTLGYDGIICGHSHQPEIQNVDDIIYMNDGDWVESCSALVEHTDGKWEIVYWTKEIPNVDTVSSSS